VNAAVHECLEQIRRRSQRPGAIWYLRHFGALSDREQQLIGIVMETAAIELAHALEEDRVTDILAVPEKVKPLAESFAPAIVWPKRA
jgi:hypothetical protein